MILLLKTVLNPAETIMKSIETSKKSSFWKKMQNFQVFGKNCKNFKFLEKIANISKFLGKIANFWNGLQKSQGFG